MLQTASTEIKPRNLPFGFCLKKIIFMVKYSILKQKIKSDAQTAPTKNQKQRQ